MERINTADKRFSDGTAAAGYLDGTVVIAKWLNDLQEEVSSFIEAMGLVLDGAKQDQLATAIKTLMQKQTPIYAVDKGVANAYVADFSPAIVALSDGMRVRTKVSATNTGASTFAPNAVAAKPIWGGNHQPLQGGEMFSGGFAELEWSAALNAGAGVWLLAGCTGGAIQAAAGAQSNHVPILGQFLAGMGAAGYVKIPVMVAGVFRNLIIQWGVNALTGTATSAQITLPIAWPNGFLCGVASDNGNSCFPAAVNGFSTTQITIYTAPYEINQANGAIGAKNGGANVAWIVIGW